MKIPPYFCNLNNKEVKKKHFVSIRFKNVYGTDYLFEGLVTGKEVDGKVIVSPNKIFKQTWGFDLPDYTSMLIG